MVCKELRTIFCLLSLAAVLGCVNVSYASVGDALFAYWLFDGDTLDYSGNDNDGAATAGAQFVSGQINSAVDLNNGIQYVDLGFSDISSPWSLSAWVNRPSSGAAEILLKSSGYAIVLEGWGSGYVGLTEYGVADYVFNYICPVGQWVHLVFVGTGSSTNLYVGGVLVDSIDIPISCPMATLGNTILNGRLRATVDEVAVWTKALTVPEIQSVYNAGAAGNLFVPPQNGSNISIGSVAYWLLDADAADYSGGVYDAAVQGSASYTPGQIGNAVDLNAAGRYIDIGQPDIVGPWTLSAWVKRSSTGTTASLMESADYAIRLEQWNSPNGEVGITEIGIADYTFNYVCPTDQWVHLSFVGTDTQTRLFVNGVLTDTLSVPIACPMDTIGNPAGIPAVVDDVAVWNRDLTEAEVQYLYSTGASGDVFCVLSNKHKYGHKRIVGYVVSSQNMDAFLPYQYDKLTDIVYFKLLPNSDGSLNLPSVNMDYIPTVIANANDNGVTVLIGLPSDGDSFPAIVADPVKLNTFVSSITQFCLDHGFDGVDIDWEEPTWNDTLRAQYTALLVALDSALSARGLALTAAVDTWTTELTIGAIDAVDRLHIMSYTGWFPQQGLDIHMYGLRKWKDFGFPRQKLIGGVPFYGAHEDHTDILYRSVVSNYNPAPDVDLIVLPDDQISFNGIDTIKAKTGYTIDNGYGGIMIWHMSCDTEDDSTSLLYAIAERSSKFWLDIPVNNGSFEQPGTTKQTNWQNVPGWNSDTVVSDSGVETGQTPTDGSWTGYLMGSDPSGWNLTNHMITAGEVFTLRVDARETGNGDNLRMDLYYDDGGSRVSVATKTVLLTTKMVEYTVLFAADDVPASIGRNIGIELNNVTGGATWLGLDNVKLFYERSDFYDGKMGLSDFAFFAQQWLQTNCGYCGGADLTSNGNVNIDDLLIFSGNWLNN